MSTSSDFNQAGQAFKGMGDAIKVLNETTKDGKVITISKDMAYLGKFMGAMGPALSMVSGVLAIIDPPPGAVEILKAISETQNLIHEIANSLDNKMTRIMQQTSVYTLQGNAETALTELKSLYDNKFAPLTYPKLPASDHTLYVQGLVDVGNDSEFDKIEASFLVIYNRFIGFDRQTSYFESLRDYTIGDISIVQQVGLKYLYYAHLAMFMHMTIKRAQGFSAAEVQRTSNDIYNAKLKEMRDCLQSVIQSIYDNADGFFKQKFALEYKASKKANYNNSQFARNMRNVLSDHFPFLDLGIGVYDRVNGWDNHCSLWHGARYLSNWEDNPQFRPDTLGETIDERDNNVFACWALKTAPDEQSTELLHNSTLDDYFHSSSVKVTPSGMKFTPPNPAILDRGNENNWTIQANVWYPILISRSPKNVGQYYLNHDERVPMLSTLANTNIQDYYVNSEDKFLSDLFSTYMIAAKMVEGETLMYGVGKSNNYHNFFYEHNCPTRSYMVKGDAFALLAFR